MTTTRPLSVCLISQEFPPHTNWGGVGVQFDCLAHGLARRGHDVVVLSRSARGAPAYERLGSGVSVWRLGAPIARKRVVGRTVDRILHARAVAAKVSELDHTRRFDVFEAPVASLDAERLLENGRFAGRTVISCHGSNFMGQQVSGLLAPLHRFDWRWSGRRERRCLRRASFVVAISRATERFVLGQGVDPARLEVIRLGVDTARFTPASGQEEGRPLVVGFVGRLEQIKGIDFVWRVMAALGPDAGVRFRLKGAIHASTRAEVLEQLHRHAGIAEYVPAGGHEEMPDFFRSLDALLLPSRFETFGLAYAEAMATGLVVFAGQGGAGPEAVVDGVTGFLVDPDGPVGPVVDRLRVFAHDRAAFREIRRHARTHVVERASVDGFVRAKERQYLRVRARHDTEPVGSAV
jgi:glycosyltransferase involved in cell wall biosynthesis